MSIDDLNKSHKSDLSRIRPINRARLIQYIVLFSAFITLVSVVPNSKEFFSTDSIRATQGANRYDEFTDSIRNQLQWLVTHGTQLEVNLFEWFYLLISHKINLISNDSIFFSFVVSLAEGLLRIIFIIVASFRLWLLIILWGVYRSFSNFKPYLGEDLLGETGNGKYFYSGIKADLSKVDYKGAPDKLVTNLASLKFASEDDLDVLNIISVLKKHGCVNETSVMLARTVGAYKDLPFFAPSPEQNNELASKEKLSKFTATFLDETLNEFSKLYEVKNGFIDSSASSKLYQNLMPFVEAIESIHKVEVAVITLSIQCGKAMGYLLEGNKWVRRSNYLHLNARSVLHSISSYQYEFESLERDRIRQALVYGSRFTVFGPIRMSENLNDQTRLLRQLVEYCLAPFGQNDFEHRLQENELYGLSFRIFRKVENHLIKNIISPQKNSTADNFEKYVTESGLVMLPIKLIVDSFLTVTTKEEYSRFQYLIDSVSNWTSNNLKINHDEDEIIGPLPKSQKIFSANVNQEEKNISQKMGLDSETRQHWAYFKNILNSFGWLAKQVGSTAVPDSSVCYLVLKGINDNEQLIGKIGYIACRSTALEQKIGKSYRKYFISAESALVTDSFEQYEKFLTGFDPNQEFLDG